LPDTSILKERILTSINRSYELNDLPGLAVGVRLYLPGADAVDSGTDGSCTYIDISAVRGFADYKTKETLEEDSVFHCASISKLFTAVAVMRLVEDRKLSLNDKVCELLPWFKPVDHGYFDATIRQLLSHIARVPDVKDYEWKNHYNDSEILKRYIMSGKVSGRKLLRASGRAYPSIKSSPKFAYSNIGYELLGAVIAEVSRMDFEEYIKEQIFIKLGMSDSTFLTFLRPRVRLVQPHYKDTDRSIRKQDYYPYTREHAPSSTLTSTLRDLKKFGDAFLSRDPVLLSEASYDQMWEQKIAASKAGVGMGLGWFIRKWDGIKLYGHDGTDEGFRSAFWVCPELGFQVIVFSNTTDIDIKAIYKRIFEAIKTSDL